MPFLAMSRFDSNLVTGRQHVHDTRREAAPARVAHSPVAGAPMALRPPDTNRRNRKRGASAPPACRLVAANPYDFGMHPRRAERVGRQGFQMLCLGMLEGHGNQGDKRCRFGVTASAEK